MDIIKAEVSMKKGILDEVETEENEEYLSVGSSIKVYVWLIAFCGILIFIGWLAFFKPKPVVITETKPETKPIETKSTMYEEFVFEDDCTIGVTKQDYSEVVQTIRASDQTGWMNLIRFGKAYFIPAGTKAKVIDYTLTLRRVRILDGNFEGVDGWCAMEYVK